MTFCDVDFKKQRLSCSYEFMDAEMADDDCSEDYDNDDFYQ